jgi:hypothetical protein
MRDIDEQNAAYTDEYQEHVSKFEHVFEVEPHLTQKYVLGENEYFAERKNADYFPKESLDGGETFIWCSVKYCAVNDVLAVDGCYWACPYGFMFYDFSNPMELPLKLYTDEYYYNLEAEAGMYTDSDRRRRKESSDDSGYTLTGE